MAAPRLLRRDREMMSWIARWGSATQHQIAFRFGTPMQWRRFKGLRQLGLVGYERPIEELPGVYYLTGRGAAEVGVHAPAPCVATWALWPHLAALDVVARVEAAGGETLSPIELADRADVRDRLPRLPSGALVAPEAVLRVDGDVVPVFAVPQAQLIGAVDRLRAVTLDALLRLEPVGARPVVLVDAAQKADVELLRARSSFDVRCVDDTVGRPQFAGDQAD